MGSYQSLVERVLDPKGTSGKDIIYACPNCEDTVTGHHLQVNYSKGYFNCFKCSFGGRDLRKLLDVLNVSLDFDYDSVESSEYSKKLDELLASPKKSTDKKIVDYSVNLSSLTQYYCYHVKELSYTARVYLNSRGISDALIEAYCIKEGLNQYGSTFEINGVSYVGRDYSGRVMIPSLRRDGMISFYVARDYLGTQVPKYLNPPKDLAFSSEDVWNLSTIELDNVIICEGVMTAISISKALNKNIAVATYGKSISDKSNSDNKDIIVTSQGEKLINRKFHTYIIFYDKDAIDSAINTCKYLYDRGANVRLVRIDTDKYGPKADANDMTREEIVDYINKSEPYNKFLDLGI